MARLEVAPTGDHQRLERVDLASDRREGDDGILTSWLIGAADVGSDELTK
jgi:hypothetical protein